MNLVDSSGWLEYFADGKNADFFASAIESVDSLVISTVNIYEVFKHILQNRGEDLAILAIATMQEGQVVPFDENIAMQAARISARSKIPIADSVILATARIHNAILWTQDADFEGLDGVKFIRKN